MPEDSLVLKAYAALLAEMWEFLLETGRCAECGDRSPEHCEFHRDSFHELRIRVERAVR